MSEQEIQESRILWFLKDNVLSDSYDEVCYLKEYFYKMPLFEVINNETNSTISILVVIGKKGESRRVFADGGELFVSRERIDYLYDVFKGYLVENHAIGMFLNLDEIEETDNDGNMIPKLEIKEMKLI